MGQRLLQSAGAAVHGGSLRTHPNARGDAAFFTMRSPFAYLSATQELDRDPLVYKSGDRFALNYLIAAIPGA